MVLSVKRVESLKKPGRYGDGDGLYLKVNPSKKPGKSKSWIFRYERDGSETFMGFGPYPLVGIAEAREMRLAARRQLLAGIDPLRARDEARARIAAQEAQRITFADAAQQYFDLHERQWKNAKHRAQFLSTLKQYVFPVLGSLPVDSIDTGLVLRCLDPIWHSRTVTASRTRQRIEKVLAWSIVRGFRSHPNPAVWVGHLKEALPARGQIAKVEHHPALPYNQMSDFMAVLRIRPGFAARALEFLILTATRSSEVIKARWSEIDLENSTWTIPPGRMKGGKEHRVPLSTAAIELLRALPRDSDFVFPGRFKGRHISNNAMAEVLIRLGRDGITVHGFRSTFRDWAAERTSFPNHVIEMALAHTIGNKVEAAYRRGDLFSKRQQLMKAWADYCASPVAAAEVVPIRAARS
jgi:integrase